MTHDLWASLNAKMIEYLDSISLKKLVDEQLAKGVSIEEAPVKRAISTQPVVKPIKVTAPNSVFALGNAFTKVTAGGRVEPPAFAAHPASCRHDPALPDLHGLRRHRRRCDPRVVDAMIPWLREHFGNPASRSHAWGWEAEEAVEKARAQVAALINADPREIVWTSAAPPRATTWRSRARRTSTASRGKHLVTVKTEHKAVLDTMRELERQGFEVTYLDVQETACSTSTASRTRCAKDTILVSVMLVNNEIGVIQDIPPSARCAASAASSSTSTPRRPPARWPSTWPRCRST
jgi:hypothetical protein